MHVTTVWPEDQENLDFWEPQSLVSNAHDRVLRGGSPSMCPSCRATGA